MTSLKEFLTKRNINKIVEVEVIEGAEPFKVKPMSSREFEDINEQCTKILPSGEIKFNKHKQDLAMILSQCVEPDFRDKGFIDSLKVVTPEEAIEKTLLAGEINRLVQGISNASGFNVGMKQKITMAKN